MFFCGVTSVVACKIALSLYEYVPYRSDEDLRDNEAHWTSD